MPVKWESHAAPLMGNRPQAIINEQLVNDCDLLVGVFWTRIGTHTGVSVSGTAEEIEQFVAQNKPVMLYFSQTPVDPDKIEIDQFTTLRTFKEKMRLKGLTESYSSIPDFRQKFSRQLAINLNSILTQAATEITEKQKTAPKSKSEPVIVPKPPENPNAVGSSVALTTEQVNEFLVKAVVSVATSDGWAPVAAIGKYLKTYTPVDYHLLGYEKLNKFLESTKLFETRVEQKSARAKNVDSAYVRLIKRG
jgi:OST-HTH/LOTUS domain